jgi:hypothetical protein
LVTISKLNLIIKVVATCARRKMTRTFVFKLGTWFFDAFLIPMTLPRKFIIFANFLYFYNILKMNE